jgi:hypothetical protein
MGCSSLLLAMSRQVTAHADIVCSGSAQPVAPPQAVPWAAVLMSGRLHRPPCSRAQGRAINYLPGDSSTEQRPSHTHPRDAFADLAPNMRSNSRPWGGTFCTVEGYSGPRTFYLLKRRGESGGWNFRSTAVRRLCDVIKASVLIGENAFLVPSVASHSWA